MMYKTNAHLLLFLTLISYLLFGMLHYRVIIVMTYFHTAFVHKISLYNYMYFIDTLQLIVKIYPMLNTLKDTSQRTPL